ncbi:TetR/AcrR family transcriptional regulator [Gordonia sp. NPDC003950]
MTVRSSVDSPDDPRRAESAQRRERVRRPADRRRHLIEVAARRFSEGGYHAVRLDDIAEAAGVSAPALYRHFPNKYALFAEATSTLAQRLADAIDGIDVNTDDPPTELARLLAAIAATAVDNRRTGGLYRWESRYLLGADREYVRSVVINQHCRLRCALVGVRADLDRHDADLLTAAMTSVVASPATHRASLPAREVASLLRDAAMSLVDLDLPRPAKSAGQPTGLAPSARRETILSQSINLFAANGFHDVTIEDIGQASGVGASGVYRYFPSKVAILEATFLRAQDRTAAIIADALAASRTPREAITELVRRYVDLCCNNPQLIAVYETEVGHLGTATRTTLRHHQRLNVEEWATWVTRERPDISATAARFLVHAELAAIADLVRDNAAPDADRITAVGVRILLGKN